MGEEERGGKRKERERWRRKKGIGLKSMNVGGWKTDKGGRGGKKRKEESMK